MPLFPFASEVEFEALVRTRLPWFRGIARRILRNAADADDAVQNACLKAWTRRWFLRTPDKLLGWLSRIVLRESYNILRQRKRENTVVVESVPETEAPAPAGNEARLRQLEAAIDNLPDLYRQTVHIAILGGLDTETAARYLGCTPNTLYQRIHKAKQLLREAMPHE